MNSSPKILPFLFPHFAALHPPDLFSRCSRTIGALLATAGAWRVGGRAEGNPADSSGPNSGLLAGGAGYAPGKVGVAFDFANGTGYVWCRIIQPGRFGAGDFSIELWVQFASLGGSRVFIAKDEGPGQSHKWMFLALNNGQLHPGKRWVGGNAAGFPGPSTRC